MRRLEETVVGTEARDAPVCAQVVRVYNMSMTIHRQITKVGGSLGVIIPRDIAEAMGIKGGTPIRLSLVGRQLVVEPTDRTMTQAEFQRAFAAVLRREAPVFQALAEHDEGRPSKPPGGGRPRRRR
jgi:antitoxin component of MazEF toxin-antitoxin module